MNNLLGFDEYTVTKKIELTLKNENIPYVEQYNPKIGGTRLDYAVQNKSNGKKLFVEVKKLQGFKKLPSSIISKISNLKNKLNINSWNNHLLVIILSSNLNESILKNNLEDLEVDYLINPDVNDVIMKVKTLIR